MRISDWSSDVCSSDLDLGTYRRTCAASGGTGQDEGGRAFRDGGGGRELRGAGALIRPISRLTDDTDGAASFFPARQRLASRVQRPLGLPHPPLASPEILFRPPTSGARRVWKERVRTWQT